jgi:hypothetical protein
MLRLRIEEIMRTLITLGLIGLIVLLVRVIDRTGVYAIGAGVMALVGYFGMIRPDILAARKQKEEDEALRRQVNPTRWS